jgi:type VII secretion-associated serine protease mycosin
VRRLRRSLAAGIATALWLLAAGPARADNIRSLEWYLDFLEAPRAQQISQGDSVIVAVLDTGVNANQPELSGSVLPGYDSVANDNAWTDLDGHGTAMASLIAAHGKNAADGALGVAPRAKILPIRIGVVGNDSDAYEIEHGIPWAVSHGAKVICMAFGAAGGTDKLKQAIAEAEAANVVLVAAVGNKPEDTEVGYPAAYPGVVAVGGVDRNGNHADLSVTGSEVVLSAPAVDIVAPRANGQYSSANGTSDATAIVAGVAALVRAKYPNLSAAEVVHRLTATAIDKGPPGRDDQYGYGIVNPVAALTADVPPLQTSPSATPQPPPTADSATPPAKTPALLIGVIVALLVVGAASGLLIGLTRRRS